MGEALYNPMKYLHELGVCLQHKINMKEIMVQKKKRIMPLPVFLPCKNNFPDEKKYRNDDDGNDDEGQ